MVILGLVERIPMFSSKMVTYYVVFLINPSLELLREVWSISSGKIAVTWL